MKKVIHKETPKEICMDQKIKGIVNRIYKDKVYSLCTIIDYQPLFTNLDKWWINNTTDEITAELKAVSKTIKKEDYRYEVIREAIDKCKEYSNPIDVLTILQKPIVDKVDKILAEHLFFSEKKEEDLDNLIKRYQLKSELPKKYDGQAHKEIIKLSKISEIYNKMELIETSIGPIEDKKRLLELLFMTNGSRSHNIYNLKSYGQIDSFKDIKSSTYQYEEHRLNRIKYIKLAYLLEWTFEQADMLLGMVSPEGGWHFRDHSELIFYVFIKRDMRELQSKSPEDLFREALWTTYDWRPEKLLKEQYKNEKNEIFPYGFKNANQTWTKRIQANIAKQRFSFLSGFQREYKKYVGYFGTFNNTALFHFITNMWEAISGECPNPSIWSNLKEALKTPADFAKVMKEYDAEISAYDESESQFIGYGYEGKNQCLDKNEENRFLQLLQGYTDLDVARKEIFSYINQKVEKPDELTERSFQIRIAYLLNDNINYQKNGNPFFNINPNIFDKLVDPSMSNLFLNIGSFFSLIQQDPINIKEYIPIFEFITDYNTVMKSLINPIVDDSMQWFGSDSFHISRTMMIFSKLMQIQFSPHLAFGNNQNDEENDNDIPVLQLPTSALENEIVALKNFDKKTIKNIKEKISDVNFGNIFTARKQSYQAYLYFKLSQVCSDYDDVSDAWDILLDASKALIESVSGTAVDTLNNAVVIAKNAYEYYLDEFDKSKEIERESKEIFLNNLLVVLNASELEKNSAVYLSIIDKINSKKSKFNLVIEELNNALEASGFSRINMENNIYDIPLLFLKGEDDYVSTFINGYQMVKDAIKELI